MFSVYLIVSLNSGRAVEAVRGTRSDVVQRIGLIERNEERLPEFSGPYWYYPEEGSRYRIAEVPFLNLAEEETQGKLFAGNRLTTA